MISRRNIRVKVMQVLYSLEASEQVEASISEKELSDLKYRGAKLLNADIHRASLLFTGQLLVLAKVAQYAEMDAGNRAAKYLPTEEDLRVNTKIAGNTFLWELLNNTTFTEKVEFDNVAHMIDDEWIKKLYQQLIKTDEYQQYIAEQSRNRSEEKKIMQFIWKKCMVENEGFQEYLHDEWNGWEDDKEMTIMLVDNYFRNNKNINFLSFISSEKQEYARSLLVTTLEKESYCMELIKPKLKNWDAERIAIIDLLLLRMGICEMLYFPTIPTKVTINEYIEIAKQYSTPQSGQFVNGVLDNLLKDLTKDNKIRKIERA
jgi:N utilization substance protein B